MYDILNNSKYKGKNFKVVKSGKKIYFHLDENRTLIYSPSGTYFRLQGKEVEARLIVKHTKEFNESKGIRLGKTRSYVNLNGDDYEDIAKQITDKYRELNRKELSDLIDSTYKKCTFH